MSHAPAHRKSAKARANARQTRHMATRTATPAPHQVILRVKRKRSDVAVDSLLVAATEDEGDEQQKTAGFLRHNKRRATTRTGNIEETMASLTLDRTNGNINNSADAGDRHGGAEGGMDAPKQKLVYKRVRTTESDGSSSIVRRRTSEKAREGQEQTGDDVGVPRQATTAATRGPGSGAAGGGEGHLDALLRDAGTKANTCSVGSNNLSSTMSDIMNYLEVRRIKAKGVAAATSDAVARRPGDDNDGGDGPRLTSAGMVARSSGADLHVIDLHPIAAPVHQMVAAKGAHGADLGGDGRRVQGAAPVLNPVERRMDEAIFKAFRSGDMSGVREVVASSPAVVNYRRRLGDGTTALMAAAFHGDLQTVRHLLSLGAKASLVDEGDKSAALIAGMRGHRGCFAELQRTADEENARSSFSTSGQKHGGGKGGMRGKRADNRGGGEGDGGGVGGEFVYDLYCFEPPVAPGARRFNGQDGVTISGTHACGQKDLDRRDCGVCGGDATPQKPSPGVPVVRLSGIGPIDTNAVGTAGAEGLELKFEHDSDWSQLGDDENGDDPDSNSEGYHGNDYPEDEDDAVNEEVGYLHGGSSCDSEVGSSSAGTLSSDDGQQTNRQRRTLKSVYGNIGRGNDHCTSSFSGGAASQEFSFAMDVTGRRMGASSLLSAASGMQDRDGKAAGIFGGGAFGNSAAGAKAEVFAWDPVRASAHGQESGVMVQAELHGGGDDMDEVLDSGNDGDGEDHWL